MMRDDTGYECRKCGYRPTQAELDRGGCPRCRILCLLRQEPEPDPNMGYDTNEERNADRE